MICPGTICVSIHQLPTGRRAHVAVDKHGGRNTDKGHTMCLKDFEEQTMPVAETLPLTCLYDGACWLA